MQSHGNYNLCATYCNNCFRVLNLTNLFLHFKLFNHFDQSCGKIWSDCECMSCRIKVVIIGGIIFSLFLQSEVSTFVPEGIWLMKICGYAFHDKLCNKIGNSKTKQKLKLQRSVCIQFVSALRNDKWL